MENEDDYYNNPEREEVSMKIFIIALAGCIIVFVFILLTN